MLKKLTLSISLSVLAIVLASPSSQGTVQPQQATTKLNMEEMRQFLGAGACELCDWGCTITSTCVYVYSHGQLTGTEGTKWNKHKECRPLHPFSYCTPGTSVDCKKDFTGDFYCNALTGTWQKTPQC